jgi:putative membrane protein
MLAGMDVDPDSRARTHLANERTFLAWFRTGVTLVALGLAAAQFLAGEGEPEAVAVQALSTVVIAGGAASIAVGLYRYRVGRRRIDDTGYLPAWTSITVTAAGGLVMAALGVAFVWFLGHV